MFPKSPSGIPRLLLIALLLISTSPLLTRSESQWKSSPNGNVRPIRQTQGYNSAAVCGNCPPGYTRDQYNSGVCGYCVPTQQSCAPGYVQTGNACSPCPCPGTTADRRFGTSCRVDADGQITCECMPGYTGRDCSQCAPGAVQMNQYPYSCVFVNQTNPYPQGCAPGSYCPPSPIPNPTPVPRPTYPCPTNNCYPQQPCPVVYPGIGNPNPNPPPNPPPPSPPPAPVIWPNPQPSPVPCPVYPTPGPGPILCPNPTTYPCPQTQCPTCPVAPQQPCPVAPQPCPIMPQPCPQPQPCPPCPQPQPCPVIQPQPCPQPQQCPPCPQTQCPSPCPSPCPQPQQCPPCPQTQCPSPCPPNCPQPVPCPRCPDVRCPSPCPQVCPPCPIVGGGNCTVNCPPPCKACPQCPDCKLDVKCPGVAGIIIPCICDPRGTLSQYGNTCYCKNNVHGQNCSECKPGYFALSAGRSEGCLQCWGSGVSNVCSAAFYFRNWIQTSTSLDCSITMANEQGLILYSRNSSRNQFSWDGKEARLSISVNNKLYWALPACFLGNRLTSYGGKLVFNRMYTGSGTNLGADNDVIIIGEYGARLYFSTFENQSSADWRKTEVTLDETTHFMFYKDDITRPATRFDILEVLAHVRMILIRATFTSTTMSASIREVQLASVVKSFTSFGLVLTVEACACPTGYTGLSCESCAVGYYRDITDMTSSVFGNCKLCPCGRNSLGCHVSYGKVHCKCKEGFTGDKCQDYEVITVTLDPFWVRDCEDTEIDFTCTFTTNSHRTLSMRLGLESEFPPASNTRSLSKTYTLSSNIGRVKCEIVDEAGTTWADVYAAIQIERCDLLAVIPPKSISIIADEFICVDEGARVVLRADIYYYGPLKIRPDWYKEGESKPRYSGFEYVISMATVPDSGTYIIVAAQGDTSNAKSISLLVKPVNSTVSYLRDDPNSLLLVGGNKTSFSNSTVKGWKPPIVASPPSKQKDILYTMQKDEASPPSYPEGYPSVTVDPTEVRVKEGESVTLRCNASGQEPMKFYWKAGHADYIPLHVKVARGSLHFKSVKKEDAGSYYCIAWNTVGQVSAKVKLYVESEMTGEDKVPTNSTVPLTLFISRSNVQVEQGFDAYFDCTTNYPNVRPVWSRKGGDLQSNAESSSNGTLIIRGVRESDAGVYVCKAMGRGGAVVEVEATLDLNRVATPTSPSRPVIRLNPKSPVKGRSGENIKIECFASGHPTPNITWTRSRDGSDALLSFQQGNFSAFEIPHLTKADEGKYTCTATNEVGSKTESLSLVVDDAIFCKTHEFRCKSGDQCVPKEDRCDGERDCKDGSDEQHCRSSKRSR